MRFCATFLYYNYVDWSDKALEPLKLYVWSSGLESWEPAEYYGLELDFLYSKLHKDKQIFILKDQTNRYFAEYAGDL